MTNRTSCRVGLGVLLGLVSAAMMNCVAEEDEVSEQSFEAVAVSSGASCNATTCPSGCCWRNTCYGGTGNALCGTGGAECSTCNSNQHCDATSRSCQPNVCNATTCPSGCCDGSNVCQAGTRNGQCGSGGGSCNFCPEDSHCENQRCVTNVCDASTCPTGCCSGTHTCQAGTSDGFCGGPSGGSCTTCGLTQTCTNRMCINKVCNATTCPSGCCAGGSCLAGTANESCGTGGGTCQYCTGSTVCQDHACKTPGTGSGTGSGSSSR